MQFFQSRLKSLTISRLLRTMTSKDLVSLLNLPQVMQVIKFVTKVIYSPRYSLTSTNFIICTYLYKMFLLDIFRGHLSISQKGCAKKQKKNIKNNLTYLAIGGCLHFLRKVMVHMQVGLCQTRIGQSVAVIAPKKISKISMVQLIHFWLTLVANLIKHL